VLGSMSRLSLVQPKKRRCGSHKQTNGIFFSICQFYGHAIDNGNRAGFRDAIDFRNVGSI
jgi:hypothetical protein